MKELSIEEKAKRYDELKVTAQELEEDGCFDKITLFDLFPELKESEDEKIRKELLDFCKNRAENYPNDPKYKNISAWIAWLENIPYTIDREKREGFHLGYKAGLEKQGEQKPTGKIEPKFKVGDKIKYSSNVYDVLAVKEHYYELSDGNVCEFKNQDKWQLVEQKSACSEEDEEIIEALISLCDEAQDNIPQLSVLKNWLKSLKDRVQPKQEWSEEDEKVIHCLEYTVKHFYEDEDTIKWCIDWLKSLRPQNRWKPSDEQMIAIQEAMNIVGILTLTGSKINSLYQDLKKLKER